MGWLDEAAQEKRDQERRERMRRTQESRDLSERQRRIRSFVRGNDRMVRRNLGLIARKTWHNPFFIWEGSGIEIHPDSGYDQSHFSWRAFRKGKSRAPCNVFEVYVLFDQQGAPLRFGVGHQLWGRDVSVYYARWQPWRLETDTVTEEALQELLKVYYQRGPCFMPPSPPPDLVNSRF